MTTQFSLARLAGNSLEHERALGSCTITPAGGQTAHCTVDKALN